MTRDETRKLFNLVSANFPEMQEKNRASVAVLWEETLADLPYDVVRMAVFKVLVYCRNFPDVEEVRKEAELLASLPDRG